MLKKLKKLGFSFCNFCIALSLYLTIKNVSLFLFGEPDYPSAEQ